MLSAATVQAYRIWQAQWQRFECDRMCPSTKMVGSATPPFQVTQNLLDTEEYNALVSQCGSHSHWRQTVQRNPLLGPI